MKGMKNKNLNRMKLLSKNTTGGFQFDQSEIQSESRYSNFKFMKRLIFIGLLLFNLQAFSQQDPLFTQYMFNKLVVNPAYAGTSGGLTIDILDRYQWRGISGAPRTLTIGAHAPIRDSKIGLGAYIYRDVLGPTINQGIMGTYAYHLKTSANGYLSLGLQFGIKHFNFDWNEIQAYNPDPMFMPQEIQKVYPDANLGIYYHTNKFFAGISSKQLLQNEYAVGEYEGKSTFSRLAMHFYGMSGAAIVLDKKIVFRPSVLFKYVKNAPLQMDINASFIFANTFWVGASFRTEKAVTLLTEFRILPTIRLGYSFDLYLNELQLHNKGSHELRLGFDVNLSRDRMKTPRYF